MKKTIIWIGIIAVIAIWGISAYNGLVNKDEAVTAAWGQVENNYQRRADLIPNLVATVKGYAQHESSTLEAVVNARAAATQVNGGNLSSEDIAAYQKAQGEVSRDEIPGEMASVSVERHGGDGAPPLPAQDFRGIGDACVVHWDERIRKVE